MTKPFEIGKTYPSRDGSREYTAVFIDPNNGGVLCVGLVGDRYTHYWFSKEGKSLHHMSYLDMIHPTTKHEGWLNIYPGKTTAMMIHQTKKIADDKASCDRVACIRIEWEE